jgi:predicted phage terminase large subunit-like protein
MTYYLPPDAPPADRLRAIRLAETVLRSRGKVLTKRKTSRTPWTTDPEGYFSRVDGAFYRPTDRQKGFIESGARFVAFVGGRGSGKTTAGVQRAMRYIARGQSGAVMTPDFEQFRFSTWPEIARWIPWSKVIRPQQYRRFPNWEPRGPFTMVFTNGAKLMCKGLHDPDSARGPNISWLWYDEGGRDKTGMGWNLSIAGVRVPRTRADQLPPTAWVTTTPAGKRHWLHKLFVDQEFPEQVWKVLEEIGHEGPISDIYYGSIEQNKSNLDPLFYASMHAAYGTGWLAKQELEGQFVEPGGNLADRLWFLPIQKTAPAEFDRIVRYWDLAATAKEQAKEDPDFTAGALVGWKDGVYWILDVQYVQARWRDIKNLIMITASEDLRRMHRTVPIRIEEDGGSGKNVVAEIMEMEELIGFDVMGDKPVNEKLIRANPWFAQAQAGNVRLLEGRWNEDALLQIEEFPDGSHDDIVDAISGAVKCLGMIVNLGDLHVQLETWKSRWEVSSVLKSGKNSEEPRSLYGDSQGQSPNSPVKPVQPKNRWNVG